jgi:hypothetical protein
LDSPVYAVGDEFITGVAEGTAVKDFLGCFSDVEFVHVFDKDGNEITDNDVNTGTGMTVKLTVDGKVIEERAVVILGDINGDGEVTAADARLILRCSAGLDELDGAFFSAADLKGTGDVTAAQARLVLRYAAGLEESL